MTMLVVTALGGSALTRRGETLTAEGQRAYIRRIAASLGSLAAGRQLVITHGNGPQMGNLALQSAAGAKVEAYPLEVRGAKTEAMVGYMLRQELANLLPFDRPVATLLAMAEVDGHDPALRNPTTWIGPMYLRDEAERMSASKGWVFRPDGDKWRRVVASPEPTRIFELPTIKWLLRRDTVVIVEGGGGIPVICENNGSTRLLNSVECVIDSDLAAQVLARGLGADMFVLLTDTDAVYMNTERAGCNAIRRASPEALRGLIFGTPAMTSKEAAACRFAAATGKPAAIGAIDDLELLLSGKAGTTVSVVESGITYAAAPMSRATA
jgi:carbamate kinase